MCKENLCRKVIYAELSSTKKIKTKIKAKKRYLLVIFLYRSKEKNNIQLSNRYLCH